MKLADGLRRHEDDGVVRCFWVTDEPLYRRYHDEEWGVPVYDDARLFEKLCLEGFQSGLSWWTILRKREAFRAAFAGFVIERVAEFGEKEVERLLANANIVRHRAKIEAAIANARAACELVKSEGSLAAFIWRFVPPVAERPAAADASSLRGLATTGASERLSGELKRRGFRFIGPTTAYAFMQAMGLVNDHIEGCPARAQVEARRRAHPVFAAPACQAPG